MAAAAFLALLVFQAQNGERIAYNCTVSDVTAAFYIFPDGQNTVTLPANKGNMRLVDVQLSAAGTDTRTADIFAGGRRTPVSILNSANLGTNLARQFLSAPMTFAPGSQLRFTQVT